MWQDWMKIINSLLSFSFLVAVHKKHFDRRNPSIEFSFHCEKTKPSDITMLFKFLLISLMATVLLFNEASANTCPRWVKLNKSPVCFGARGNQYGKFTTFNRNIFVSQFMLVHRTGTVSCDKKQYSYWGCTPNHSDLAVVLTDQQNRLLAPASFNGGGWYNLAGYTSSSSVLVFCAPKKPHCVFANSELRLWYGVDYRNRSESDNAGKTCADVYGLLV
ncbi:hypothetical protein ACROYT_G036668 [Oculina patagonica]